jgi:phosphomannomutase
MNTKIKHKFDAEIVRKYDIRGIYGENLTNQDAFFLGIAIGNYLNILKLNKIVSIGRDGRNSSEPLWKQLIFGLRESGCDVIDLGIYQLQLLISFAILMSA